MTRPQFHIIGTEKDAETVDVDELYDLIKRFQFKHRKERKLNKLPALAEMLKIAVKAERPLASTASAEYLGDMKNTKQSGSLR